MNYFEYIHQKNCRNDNDKKVCEFWHNIILSKAKENNWLEYKEEEFLNRLNSSFNQYAWELYLAYKLNTKGLPIKRHISPKGGPDFYIDYQDYKIWIECISVTEGTKQNTVPSRSIQLATASEIELFEYPSNEIKLRITSGLSDKIKKIKKYKTNEIIHQNDLYIIAINYSDALSGYIDQDDNGIPIATSVIYGIGERTWIYNGQDCKSVTPSCKSLTKANDETISLNFFKDPNLIGIISCNSDLWHSVINRSDSLFNYHSNPKMKKKIFKPNLFNQFFIKENSTIKNINF